MAEAGPGPGGLQALTAPLGRICTAVGTAMLVPTAVAGVTGRGDDASAFVIGAATGIILGRIVRTDGRPPRPTWPEALVIAGAGWPLAAALAAVPLALSPHYAGYGDALFEAMSGLTTTGLTLVHDLDHLPLAVNLWRHLLHLIGGQATIVLALVLFTSRGLPPGTRMLGESRRRRVLPDVRRTTVRVLGVAGGFAALALPALTAGGLAAGLSPGRALWHAGTLFTSAFDTGAFAATSAGLALLHSPAIEVMVAVLMLAGATSIGLHLLARRGQLGALGRDLEARVLAGSLLVLGGTLLVGLVRAGALADAGALSRKGLFTLLSAHTTTGLEVVDGRLVAAEWGPVAPAVLVAAMGIGGMAASAAGGVNAFRTGVLLKGVLQDVRRVLLPRSAVVVSAYHHGGWRVLDDGDVRAAAGLVLLYLTAFVGGGLAILGVVGGISITEAMFETAAAASTTGLSLGVLQPSAPATVKALLGVEMWLGRVQFFAALAAVAALARAARRRA